MTSCCVCGIAHRVSAAAAACIHIESTLLSGGKVLFVSISKHGLYADTLLKKQFDIYAWLWYSTKQENKAEKGDSMNDSQQILELARQNNGVITAAMAADAGYSMGSLKYLTDTGRLERNSRGVYTLPDVLEDEFINIQSRYKKGIFSLDTALFLFDLTDRTPIRFHMTFPPTYNLTNPKANGIICSGSKEPFYSLGIEEVSTPAGNIVRCYSAERTLCDILRARNHTDIQVAAEAFKQYVTRKDKNIPLLSEYAMLLRVEERLRPYMEVLL